MRGALAQRLLAERKEASAPAAAAAIPPELLEQLGALGYVGGGTGGAGNAPGADPKDKLEDYKAVNTLMREGLTHLREKDAGRGRRSLRGAPGARRLELRGALLPGAGPPAARSSRRPAVVHFEAAIARLPAYGAAYTGLADAWLALGEPQRALAALEKGKTVSPRDARLFEAEAAIFQGLEKPREAIAALRGRVAPGAQGRAPAREARRALPRPPGAREGHRADAGGGDPRSGARRVLERARHGAGRERRARRSGGGLSRGGPPRLPGRAVRLQPGTGLAAPGQEGRSGAPLPEGPRAAAGLRGGAGAPRAKREGRP